MKDSDKQKNVNIPLHSCYLFIPALVQSFSFVKMAAFSRSPREAFSTRLIIEEVAGRHGHLCQGPYFVT